MNLISGVRDAMVQADRRPLVLVEDQIVQAKITKIYPNNKAEVQIGNHKLVAEILTPLSVGKQYFFQVQNEEQILLKVLGESQTTSITPKVDIEALLSQLGLRATKGNMALLTQLVQDKIPFNQAQLTEALPILTNASNKAEAIDILKTMMIERLPLTEDTFQAVKTHQQASMSHLMQQVYNQMAQLNSPTELEQNLMKNLETLLYRPVTQARPAIAEQIMQNLSQSNASLNALKIMGLVNAAVNQTQWTQATASTLSAYETAANRGFHTEQVPSPPLIDMPVSQEQAEQLRVVLNTLIENSDQIQRAANQTKAIFPNLSSATLTHTELSQALQMIEKELFQLLPKETVEVLQQVMQQSSTTQQQTQTAQVNQQALFQMLEILSNSTTFQEVSTIAASETNVSEKQQQIMQQPVQEQFMDHVRHFMKIVGLNDEHMLKMGMEQMNQLDILKTEPSIKGMLMEMVQSQDGRFADRAQTLLHFINGMQMQTVVESNNMLQASFTLPGDKLALNKDMFMQFEGRKDDTGKIDADFCRILFVLDLARLNETMIDMHVQKRIISIQVYNEQNEPPSFATLKPVLKKSLSDMDYHLSAVKWKPLYDKTMPLNSDSFNKEQEVEYDREGYDFLI